MPVVASACMPVLVLLFSILTPASARSQRVHKDAAPYLPCVILGPRPLTWLCDVASAETYYPSCDHTNPLSVSKPGIITPCTRLALLSGTRGYSGCCEHGPRVEFDGWDTSAECPASLRGVIVRMQTWRSAAYPPLH